MDEIVLTPQSILGCEFAPDGSEIAVRIQSGEGPVLK